MYSAQVWPAGGSKEVNSWGLHLTWTSQTTGPKSPPTR
jgi:hypothetical protein